MLNLQTFADYFTMKGYQVLPAQNGKETLEIAQTRRPDLIMLDIRMPEMDGFEAMRRIRAADGVKTIPIIAVTALAMPGDRERCLDAGANAYFSKPVNLRSLHQMIAELLAGKSPEPAG